MRKVKSGRRLNDLIDIQEKKYQVNYYYLLGAILFFLFCISILYFDFTIPNFWGADTLFGIFALVVVVGSIIAPLFIASLVKEIIQQKLGYPILSDYSVSESIRFCIWKIHFHGKEYNETDDLSKKKEQEKNIRRSLSTLIGVLGDSQKYLLDPTHKSFDFFSKDYWQFASRMSVLSVSINEMLDKQNKFPSEFLSKLHTLSEQLEESNFEATTEINMSIVELIKCYGINIDEFEHLNESLGNDSRLDMSSVARLFSHVVGKIVLIATPIMIVYTAIIIGIKPNITNDTAWGSGIVLLGICIAAVIAYDTKNKKN